MLLCKGRLELVLVIYIYESNWDLIEFYSFIMGE